MTITAAAMITTADDTTSVVAVPATVTDGPLAATGTSLSAAQGVDTGGVVVATFTAADANATASDFGATVDWGDGSGQSLFNTITQSGSTFSVIGDYTYLTQGTFPVMVTITDAGGATATASTTATVGAGPIAATAASINAAEGAALNSASVATFTGDATAATIDWGDGTTPTSGTVGDDAVYGSHTYAEAGSYAVNVTLTDANGYTAVAASTAYVIDAALTAGTVSVTGAVEGQGFSGAIVTFTDANPSASVGDFTAVIAWGDGATTAGAISASGGGFSISGGNTYEATGAFPVAVTVTDKDGASVVGSGTATVADATITGSVMYLGATQGVPVLGAPLATFTDPYAYGSPSDYTATIHWGDGTTSVGVVQGSDGTYGVRGSHTYASAGSYTLQVTLSDSGGGPTVSGTAQVALTPSYVVGNLYVSGGGSPQYTATIDWGDGTSPTAGVVTDTGYGNFTISGPHAYGEEGTYNVTVSVTQVGGGAATLLSTALVAATALMAAAPPIPAAAPTVQVQDETFSTTEAVTSDDGKTTYTNPDWEADRGNVQDPLVIVSGQKLALSGLDFVVGGGLQDWAQQHGMGITATGWVTGNGLPADMEVTAPLEYDGKRLVLLNQNAPVQSNVPFDRITQTDMQIRWVVTLGNGQQVNAGVTSNRLYVPFRSEYVPAGTHARLLYETVLDVGTTAAAGKTSDIDVAQAIMEKFDTLSIKEANGGPVITYWNDWEKSQNRQTTAQLLKTHDGNCVGWTQFFLDVLEAQGVSGGTMDVVASGANNPREGLLVAKWDVGPNGANNTDPRTNGVGAYPYVNTLTKLGVLKVKVGGKWDYGWNAKTSSIFFDTDPKKYLNAQGESVRAQPPLALFDNHVVAEITIGAQTILFDPSYGKKYELTAPLALYTPVKPMDAAIPYFFTADPYHAGRFLIRQNPGGILILGRQLDSKARLILSDQFEHDHPQP